MRLPDGLSSTTADAIGIWLAGIEAVRADRVIEREVQANGDRLIVRDDEWQLSRKGRLIVVGAGKATFKMAQGLMTSLKWIDPALEVTGWINIPEATCDGQLDSRIHVCEARPMGVNEPTPRVVAGTQRIMELVAGAGPDDTVICLLSGGGSALLCAPIDGVTLEDKIAVTRLLSGSGATIELLNAVRSLLSRVKRGGLARSCNAKQTITLVLSDVLGNPLETIASGPMLETSPVDKRIVVQDLQNLHLDDRKIPASIWRRLNDQTIDITEDQRSGKSKSRIVHYVIANNATAVDAAGAEAVRRGYAYYMQSSPRSEGPAEEIGRAIARQCLELERQTAIQCIISGGEPSVVLPEISIRGRGGRNQQLVLAALDELERQGVQPTTISRMSILAGGTDGEDGPTDAAGAWLDANVMRQADSLGLDVRDYLRRCDAYTFFNQTNSLLKTGPTHTNVCDIRIALFDSRKTP